jgi:hypothetical protein
VSNAGIIGLARLPFPPALYTLYRLHVSHPGIPSFAPCRTLWSWLSDCLGGLPNTGSGKTNCDVKRDKPREWKFYRAELNIRLIDCVLFLLLLPLFVFRFFDLLFNSHALAQAFNFIDLSPNDKLPKYCAAFNICSVLYLLLQSNFQFKYTFRTHICQKPFISERSSCILMVGFQEVAYFVSSCYR